MDLQTENGSIERYKARLVAQGYSQRQGIDYEDTFSPEVRFESVRAVLALAAQRKMMVHQMVVCTAFLNGDLTEDVYMKQPEGFVVAGKEDHVCKLKRSICGLKQSPRCWNYTLHSHLTGMGFEQSNSDPCIYMSSEGEPFIIAVYVDDILLTGSTDEHISRVKRSLSSRFKVKDMGMARYFLGVKIEQNTERGEIWIGQPQYTKNVLQQFKMTEAKSVRTPLNSTLKLVKATSSSERADQEVYQSAVGKLLYLSTRTRPDISHAVAIVARYTADPTIEH